MAVTPVTPITALPTPPTRGMAAAAFVTAADAFLAAFPTFRTEVNAAGAATEANATAAEAAASSAETAAQSVIVDPNTMIASSITSLAIGSGTKVLNIGTGKSFRPGQTIVAAVVGSSAINYMEGRVSSYTDSGAGALEFVVPTSGVGGSGTHADWTISLSPTAAAIGDLQDQVTAKHATADKASVTELLAGSDADKRVPPSILWGALASVALTDGATITPDGAAGVNFHVTLGGNRTLGSPANFKPGQNGRIRIIQPASGGPRTLSFHGDWDFPGGVPPTLSTAANAVDRVTYFVHASGQIECGFDRAFG